MSVHLLDFKSNEFSVKKIFWFLVFFEAITLAVALFTDLIFMAYYAGIVITPLLLLAIPLEPTVGIILMLLATGFDFLARISEDESNLDFNFTYFHIALFVTFFSIFLNLILKRRLIIRSINLWMPLLVFYLVLSYSLIYTPQFLQGSLVFARVVVMGLICLIVVESIDKSWKVKLVLWGMTLIPVAISSLTIYQFMTEGALYSSQVQKMATSLGMAVYRSTGTFDNPNKLACFLMIGIVVPFGMMFIKKFNPFFKTVLLLSMVVTGIGIIMTFSRAGWLSTLFGVIFIIFLHKRWSFFAIGAGFVFIALILITIKIPEVWELVFDRFGSIFSPDADDSSSSRISLVKTGIWMWQDHPIFGVGLRGFPKLYYDYVDPNMPYILMEVNEPHTIQAEILAEEGLIGLIVASWLFFTMFFFGIKTSHSITDDYLRCAQIAITSLMVSFIVNFTFATDMTNNSFWIVIGMMYAIPYVDKLNLEWETPHAEEAALP